MAEIASAYISLLASAKDFPSSVNRQITPGLNSTAKTAGSRFGRVFAYSSMSPLKAIGGAALGFFAANKVKDFLSASIGEAREAQKVSALTAQVIKSTGGAANVSAKQVGNLASAISRKVGIDDEAIQSGANLLLTFKAVANETGRGNDIFNQATRSIVDMAAAMAAASGGQVDFKSATTLVGKALNDPIKGLSALSRVGVTFTEQQKAQIQTLVKSGNTVKAQKLILAELKSEFGGAAAASATAGEKFQVAMGNFKEAVGTALLPLLDRGLRVGTQVLNLLMDKFPPAFAAFKSAIAPVVDLVREFVSKHLEAFKVALAALTGGTIAAVIGVIGGGLVSAFAALASVLASPILLIGALAGAAVYAYTKFAGFRAGVGQVIATIQTLARDVAARLAPMLPQVVAIFGQIASTVKSYLSLAAIEVRIAVAVIQNLWAKFGGPILSYVTSTFQNVLTVIKGALNVIQGVIRTVTALIKGDWSGAWEGIKQIVRGAAQIITGLISQLFAQLKLAFSAGWIALKAIVAAAWDGIKAVTKAGVGSLLSLVGSLPGKIKRAIGDLSGVLYEKGVNLVQGLIDGAGSLLSRIGEFFLDKLPGWIRGPFEKAMDINSPSKVFFKYGGHIVQGLVLGIADGQDSAIKSAAGMAVKIQSAVLDRLKSMRDRIKDTLKGLLGDFANLKSNIASTFTGNLFDTGTNDLAELFSQGKAGAKFTSQFNSFRNGLMQDAIAQWNTGMLTDLPDVLSWSSDQFAQAFIDSLNTKQIEGFQQGATLSAFQSNLQSTQANLQALVAASKKLINKFGIDPKFISSLFQSGNSDLILALASGSKAQAQQDASMFANIGSLSNQLGGNVADGLLGNKIDATNKELQGLRADVKQLTAVTAEQGRRFGQEVNSAASGKNTGGGKVNRTGFLGGS